MPHDEHFLQRLDRFSREHTELALALYRDHQFVRALLYVVAAAGATERVALALEHEPGGPHVIVARDGAFVTCLGKGMVPVGCTIVTRGYIDAALASNEDLNARYRTARSFARPGEDDEAFLRRIATRKNLLSREEMRGASALAPLFAHALYTEMGKSVIAVLEACGHMRAPVDPRRLRPDYVEMHARKVWMAGYAAQLCAFAGAQPLDAVIAWLGERTFTWFTTLLATGTLVYRGIWAAGKVGEPLAPSYRDSLSRSRHGPDILEAAMALTAIALRHEKARDGIVRFFRDLPGGDDDLGAARGYARTAALETIDRADEMVEMATLDGADRHYARCAARLAPDDPDRLRSPTDCPPELARAALLQETRSIRTPSGLSLSFGLVPLLARVDVEAFHYPHAIGRKLLSPWGAEAVAAHIDALVGSGEKKVPVTLASRAGRNEPCPCGSGQKLKRCCWGKRSG